MASRNLIDLTPQVREKAELVKKICREQSGFSLLIYCTLRPLTDQALLYRQSRPYSQINKKMIQLRDQGFDYIADIIDQVGPCSGPHVTNAAPGESWHNYGEAFDAVPLIGGKAAWSYNENKALWDAYGEALRIAEMNWAGEWTSFKEYPHAQLHKGSNPLREFEPEEIKLSLIKNNLLAPDTIA